MVKNNIQTTKTHPTTRLVVIALIVTAASLTLAATTTISVNSPTAAYADSDIKEKNWESESGVLSTSSCDKDAFRDSPDNCNKAFRERFGGNQNIDTKRLCEELSGEKCKRAPNFLS